MDGSVKENADGTRSVKLAYPLVRVKSDSGFTEKVSEITVRRVNAGTVRRCAGKEGMDFDVVLIQGTTGLTEAEIDSLDIEDYTTLARVAALPLLGASGASQEGPEASGTPSGT